MEESLLREILAVQKEILAEVRLVRQALVPRLTATGQHRSAPAPAPQPTPAPEATATIPPAPAATPTQATAGAQARPTPAAAEPVQPTPPGQPAASTPSAAPQATSSQSQSPQPAPSTGSMLTLDELADLGGQFLEPGQLSRGAKVAPVEAADLLRDIKAKNRAKRSAFAEFDKFGRGR